jgi:hypothetical protein
VIEKCIEVKSPEIDKEKSSLKFPLKSKTWIRKIFEASQVSSNFAKSISCPLLPSVVLLKHDHEQSEIQQFQKNFDIDECVNFFLPEHSFVPRL